MLMFLQITQVPCENASSNPGSTQQGPRSYTSNIPRHSCCRWPRNQTLRREDRPASHSPAMNMPLAGRHLLGVSNGPESTVGAKAPLVGKRHACACRRGHIHTKCQSSTTGHGGSLPTSGDKPWTPQKNLCLQSLPGTGANTKLGGGGREAARP